MYVCFKNEFKCTFLSCFNSKDDVIIEKHMPHDITLKMKPFSYNTNINHTEVRIEFTIYKYTYLCQQRQTKLEVRNEKCGLGIGYDE